MYGLRYRGALDSTTQAELEGLIATLQEFLLREHNEDGTHRPVGSDLVPVPIGGVIAWMTPTPPSGWLLCDGRAVSRTVYDRLFKAIGTRFGSGNGVDTFNLPNMEGRFPLGSFSGASIGDTGGTWNHTHGIEEDGVHAHTITSDGSHSHSQGAHQHAIGDGSAQPVSDGDGSAGAIFSATQTDIFADSGTSTDGSHDHDGATGQNGSHDHGGETDEANPPYFALNFIILAGA